MTVPSMDDFTFKFVEQDDNLSATYTPSELKTNFDSRGVELRTFINELVGILNSTTTDESGADNIGINEVIAGSGTTVRERVEWLKTELDEAILGAIPDNSLTTAKYQNGSVTAAKVAADVATQAELDAEASTRSAADSTLQGNINSEASTRSTADTTLQGNIDDLAGTGRTTETVKGNADAIATKIPLSTVTAAGDIIIGTAANTVGRLAIGSAGESLKVNSTGDGYEFGIGDAWDKILVDNGTTIINGTLTLASNTAQIDFDSLGLENYRYIKLLFKCSSAAAGTNLKIKFNDSAVEYHFQNFYTASTALAATQGQNNVGILLSNSLPSKETYPNNSAFGEMLIENSNAYKYCIIDYATSSSSSNYTDIYKYSYKWNVADLINKISILSSDGIEIAAGSMFTLLGVK